MGGWDSNSGSSAGPGGDHLREANLGADLGLDPGTPVRDVDMVSVL